MLFEKYRQELLSNSVKHNCDLEERRKRQEKDERKKRRSCNEEGEDLVPPSKKIKVVSDVGASVRYKTPEDKYEEMKRSNKAIEEQDVEWMNYKVLQMELKAFEVRVLLVRELFLLQDYYRYSMAVQLHRKPNQRVAMQLLRLKDLKYLPKKFGRSNHSCSCYSILRANPVKLRVKRQNYVLTLPLIFLMIS